MARFGTIGSRGRITLPREIRNRIGLKEGDRVEFVVEKDRTSIRPARAAENPFAKYVGALPVFSGAREVNAWIHTLRDEETPRTAIKSVAATRPRLKSPK
jgi:antitoxin PrlF